MEDYWTLSAYYDSRRRWPEIDPNIHKRCCKLQNSNYGEFVKKENKEMGNNSNYTYGMPTLDQMTFSQCKKDHYVIPSIAKVIYNPPATIILWSDKTKTVVKCCENDIYDPEKGFAMAVIKKLCGNDSALFHKLFKTWVLESGKRYTRSVPTMNISIDDIDPVKQLKEMINRIFGVGGSDGN